MYSLFDMNIISQTQPEAYVPRKKRSMVNVYSRSAKRQRRNPQSLSRALALRKPEIKEYLAERVIPQLDNSTISTTLVTDIIQGPGFSERIGDKIKVLSIEVWGHVGAERVNWASLYCPKNNSQVSSTDFVGTAQGLIHSNTAWELGKFHGYGETNCFIMKKSFPLGMDIHWNNDGVVQRNPVYLTFGNRSGLNVTLIAATFRVRYVDI
jgi:hypothetical protein